jgi:predicted DNA-binding transcriptional regulator AlpA
MVETNPNPDPSDRIGTRKLTCTLPDAADRMGVRESWLRAKVKDREVPFTQVGKVSVGFTDEQIAQVIESLSVKPRKDPQSLTTPRARKRAA